MDSGHDTVYGGNSQSLMSSGVGDVVLPVVKKKNRWWVLLVGVVAVVLVVLVIWAVIGNIGSRNINSVFNRYANYLLYNVDSDSGDYGSFSMDDQYAVSVELLKAPKSKSYFDSLNEKFNNFVKLYEQNEAAYSEEEVEVIKQYINNYNDFKTIVKIKMDNKAVEDDFEDDTVERYADNFNNYIRLNDIQFERFSKAGCVENNHIEDECVKAMAYNDDDRLLEYSIMRNKSIMSGIEQQFIASLAEWCWDVKGILDSTGGSHE